MYPVPGELVGGIVAESLGVTPSEVGLAWLLHHASNVLLIPGTANATHLEVNIAVSKIALDAETLATLDAIESRSNDVVHRSVPAPVLGGEGQLDQGLHGRDSARLNAKLRATSTVGRPIRAMSRVCTVTGSVP